MTNTTDPVLHWTRQLAFLRAQAAKGSRIAPCGDLTESVFATCDSLLRELAGSQLECDRLRAEVRTSAAAWTHLFDVIPGACLLTDSVGSIVNANRAAGVLLNLSAKRLKDRELVVFSGDRAAFAALIHRLARGGDDELRATLTVRPRERRPVDMDVVIVPLPDERSRLWLWFLAPAAERQKTTGAQVLPHASLSVASPV
jgi:PAS domain-containing protein